MNKKYLFFTLIFSIFCIQNTFAMLQWLRGASNFPPLHYAAIIGDFEKVKKLIAEKANVNARATDDVTELYNMTPLHCASLSGHLAIVQLLIRCGAKVGARAKNNDTPLLVACRRGYFGIVQCLVQNGADVDAQDNYDWTPLHFASLSGRLAIVHFLIQYGANINARDKNNWTPLHVAAHHCDEMDFYGFGFSFRKFSLIRSLFPFKQDEKRTQKKAAICKLLLENHADVLAKTNDGRTAADLAKEDPELYKLLSNLANYKKTYSSSSVLILNCGHTFLSGSINAWERNTCPICEQPINPKETQLIAIDESEKSNSSSSSSSTNSEKKLKEKESGNDNKKDDVEMKDKDKDKKTDNEKK